MKYVIKIILAVFMGGFLMTAVAWINGHENFFTHKYREDINPLNINNADMNKYYYSELVVIETISPSTTPLLFVSKYDTISNEIMSRNK